eukprot:TRINITY_DN5616_c1_g1_i1.p1 TRINITY_DN5616_c1_g1~~TRINITY_DN5616_c1_g1_i1.p1  ORF type:complete len:462 (+),score=96.08 TRINITY_DN5616_c1_g1_i1:49-1386(+)
MVVSPQRSVAFDGGVMEASSSTSPCSRASARPGARTQRRSRRHLSLGAQTALCPGGGGRTVLPPLEAPPAASAAIRASSCAAGSGREAARAALAAAEGLSPSSCSSRALPARRLAFESSEAGEASARSRAVSPASAAAASAERTAANLDAFAKEVGKLRRRKARAMTAAAALAVVQSQSPSSKATRAATSPKTPPKRPVSAGGGDAVCDCQKAWVAGSSASLAGRSTPSAVGSAAVSISGGPTLTTATGSSFVVPSFSHDDVRTTMTTPLAARNRALSGGVFGWKRGKRIGHGSYGCVYKALDIETGRIFAVKQAAIDEHSDEDKRYLRTLESELDIFKGLRHPHIVSYLGHDYFDGSLYIYMDYVSGGSMAAVLSEFGPLCGEPLRIATAGLSKGLDYLHSRSPPVLHRDIKGANALVDLNFCVLSPATSATLAFSCQQFGWAL